MSEEDLERIFMEVMVSLGNFCEVAVEPDDFERYSHLNARYGFAPTLEALKTFFDKERYYRGKGMLPAVATVERVIRDSVTLSAPSQVQEVTHSILRAFKRFGENYANWSTYAPMVDFESHFRDVYGEAAWDVLQRMGGYVKTCQDWNDAKSREVFTSQLREYVRSALERHEKGLLEPVALPTRSSPKISGVLAKLVGATPSLKQR